MVQIIDSSGRNIVVPFTRNSNDIVFYFGTVSQNTDYTVLISGSSSLTASAIEAIASASAILPEIQSFTMTVNAGNNVFATLTHNLGVANSDYIVQVIDANKDNVDVPFTRNANDVVFFFATLAAQQTYRVIIVH